MEVKYLLRLPFHCNRRILTAAINRTDTAILQGLVDSNSVRRLRVQHFEKKAAEGGLRNSGVENDSAEGDLVLDYSVGMVC